MNILGVSFVFSTFESLQVGSVWLRDLFCSVLFRTILVNLFILHLIKYVCSDPFHK